jgi:uncharacterized protein Yka (UPF0111/DUF47 family)
MEPTIKSTLSAYSKINQSIEKLEDKVAELIQIVQDQAIKIRDLEQEIDSVKATVYNYE